MKTEVSGEGIDDSNTQFVPSIGVGIGLDIGVHPVVTVTPLVTYHRYFGAEWKDLGNYFTPEGTPTSTDVSTDMSHLFLGLKLQLRLDEVRKAGWR